MIAGSTISITAPRISGSEIILTPDALEFVTHFHHKFNQSRLDLLVARAERQQAINEGNLPTLLPQTRHIRDDATWHVTPIPADLQDRRVEITGPVDRKMMINALNSGAQVFMADFEDSLSPTWENIIHGQINLYDAVRHRISYAAPDSQKFYELNDEPATLVVRPRGWHLDEKHVRIAGESVSASLFDFGLFFFHNAAELITRGSGPYFYLAKLENHLEARLWNDVFREAQALLGIPPGMIKATVLIETILAAFEMEEILYELRDHSTGLNAGRWDYIFSLIKKFRQNPDFVLPDRGQVTMLAPFMHSYSQRLVWTCHRRGAHAIGGMAAFIPNRQEPEITERAIRKVHDDKVREAHTGYDGTWIAHPDLVPVAKAVFDDVLGLQSNQIAKQGSPHIDDPETLLNVRDTDGSITEAGIRLNISVAIRYLAEWLSGNGAAAINNLMEDAATAEISRAQLWQWVHHRAHTDEGHVVTIEWYQQLRDEEVRELAFIDAELLRTATQLLDELVQAEKFPEFLTLYAYDYI